MYSCQISSPFWEFNNSAVVISDRSQEETMGDVTVICRLVDPDLSHILCSSTVT